MKHYSRCEFISNRVSNIYNVESDEAKFLQMSDRYQVVSIELKLFGYLYLREENIRSLGFSVAENRYCQPFASISED